MQQTFVELRSVLPQIRLANAAALPKVMYEQCGKSLSVSANAIVVACF